jgi:hypothetical protein
VDNLPKRKKAADTKFDANRTAVCRQVSQQSLIPTVNPRSRLLARRAATCCRYRSQMEGNVAFIECDSFKLEDGRVNEQTERINGRHEVHCP